MKYENFDLRIERFGEMYHASVANAPGGDAECDFSLPISEADLTIFRLATTNVKADARGMESSGIRAAKEFGEKLFQAVFVGDVRSCLLRSLDALPRGEVGLRLRIHLSRTAELTNVPWEYLYEPSGKRFLALSNETPVVRYLEIPERIQPVAVQPPVRILVVVASPKDLRPIGVDGEWKKLKGALAKLEAAGVVVVDQLEKPTYSLLEETLSKEKYHIFHFIGHGQFDVKSQEGQLMFEDEGGWSAPVTADALGLLLRDAPTLRLAVLNSCEGARADSRDLLSGTAQTLVQQGVPAVIAMQYEISDRSAQSFAEALYKGLARGSPVDAALALARKIMYAEGSAEWGAPVLYMRSPDGRVFDVSVTAVPLKKTSSDSLLDVTAAEPSLWRQRWIRPTLLLACVFIANWLETTAEKTYRSHVDPSNLIAYALHGLERNFSFEQHDMANPLAIYGYSISYFFLLPLLGVAVAVALARRKNPRAYRTLALAVGIDYLVSLPFFIFFPVPERWTYQDSGAILLSDLWTARLIESIRPISGLNNCFPSTHVSLTVILIAFCYVFRLRFRISALFLGLTIILSTFVLGIHWMADIVAGVAVGVLSASLALAGIGQKVLAPATNLEGLGLKEGSGLDS